MAQDNCQQIKSLIAEIRTTLAQFDEAHGQVLAINDLHDLESKEQLKRAEGCMAHLDDLITELRETANPWHLNIYDAVNPYYEGEKVNGLNETSGSEILDKLEIDLEKILSNDTHAYFEAGLIDWDRSLPPSLPDYRLSAEKIRIIKQQIKAGAIPIFMPGKNAQLIGLAAAVSNLKLQVVMNGKDNKPLTIEANKTKGVMKEMIDAEDNLLVDDVPINPYILLVKPTFKPEVKSREQVEEQKEQLADSYKEVSGVSVSGIRVGEYLVLQNRFTVRLANLIGPQPREIRCLDMQSITFFDNLPHSNEFGIEYCPGTHVWSDTGKEIYLAVSSFNKKADPSGYRLAARIELT